MSTLFSAVPLTADGLPNEFFPFCLCLLDEIFCSLSISEDKCESTSDDRRVTLHTGQNDGSVCLRLLLQPLPSSRGELLLLPLGLEDSSLLSIFPYNSPGDASTEMLTNRVFSPITAGNRKNFDVLGFCITRSCI